jgi:hypothetical protein
MDARHRDESEINKLLIHFTGSSAAPGMHLPVTFVVNDEKKSRKTYEPQSAKNAELRREDEIDRTPP